MEIWGTRNGKSNVFWELTLSCSLLAFRGMYCLHLQGQRVIGASKPASDSAYFLTL
jgi:hypothetical protein